MKQLVKHPSGAPSRNATCEWFYHAPSKQSEKASEVVIPPTSQIPGLSDLSEPHNEAVNGSRRKWIRDTDSDYVKLAKRGGRPDLLKQVPTTAKRNPAMSYSLPDWYTHERVTPTPGQADGQKSNMPDYMVHKASDVEQNENKYEGKRGPFDFDQKSVWQRDCDDNEKENLDDEEEEEDEDDIKVKLPAIKQSFKNEGNTAVAGIGPPTTREREGNLGKKCFFPPMPVSRNRDNTNFTKLMSNGYGDDWFQQRADHDKTMLKDSEMCPQE
ncbi:uncharacterized protein C7orf57 homolog isoform 2-T2 [Discoglossus pictus]